MYQPLSDGFKAQWPQFPQEFLTQKHHATCKFFDSTEGGSDCEQWLLPYFELDWYDLNSQTVLPYFGCYSCRKRTAERTAIPVWDPFGSYVNFRTRYTYTNWKCFSTIMTMEFWGWEAPQDLQKFLEGFYRYFEVAFEFLPSSQSASCGLFLMLIRWKAFEGLLRFIFRAKT